MSEKESFYDKKEVSRRLGLTSISILGLGLLSSCKSAEVKSPNVYSNEERTEENYIIEDTDVLPEYKKSSKVYRSISIEDESSPLNRLFVLEDLKRNTLQDDIPYKSELDVNTIQKDELELQSEYITDNLTAQYNVPMEGSSDRGVFHNMLVAKDLVNDYFETNAIKPIDIPIDSSLLSIVSKIYNEQEKYAKNGFRYLEAMEYFDPENPNIPWVYPERTGIKGAGACDIATLVKRVITSNYEKIGHTETYKGHTIERWGPFVILFKNHTYYPGIASDMIAVSSFGKKNSDLMNISNTEFLVYLLDEGTFPSNTQLKIKIEERNGIFEAIMYTDTR